MTRPEVPITNDGPLAEFARDLRAARAAADITYRQMAERTNYSVSILSSAANGRQRPTWDVAWAYLHACKVSDADRRSWHRRWSRACSNLYDA
jgi:transcriptional regulator with XRE-family HTH domain